MLKIIVTVVTLIGSQVAFAEVGTTIQKLTLGKQAISTLLPTECKLVAESLNFSSRLGWLTGPMSRIDEVKADIFDISFVAICAVNMNYYSGEYSGTLTMRSATLGGKAYSSDALKAVDPYSKNEFSAEPIRLGNDDILRLKKIAN